MMSLNSAKLIILVIIIIVSFPIITTAHSGRTDSYGCHTCKTNCASWGLSYGEYHCHQSKGLPQPEEPIKSHKDGTTEPAPEYSQSKIEASRTNNYAAAASTKESDNSIWWILGGMGVVGLVIYLIKKGK
jgi:hypothetical protein